MYKLEIVRYNQFCFRSFIVNNTGYTVFTDICIGVEGTKKAVLVGTPATLSCKVTGLTAGEVNISWLPSNSGTVTTGSLDTSSGTQTSTLLIENPQSDQTYTCKVTSTTYTESPYSETEIALDTFSKYLGMREYLCSRYAAAVC